MKRVVAAGQMLSLCVLVLLVLLFGSPALADHVCTPGSQQDGLRMVTSLGVMDLVLCTEDAPETVANLLTYVNDGAYTDTGFLHRSVQEQGCEASSGICIIQGGGFYLKDGLFTESVTLRDPIDRENTGPNIRFSIAMARADDANSATSQWFINTRSNPNLDIGGFAVFGEVVRGRGVATLIAKQAIHLLNDRVMTDVPLIDYPDDGSSHFDYLVYVTSIEQLPEPGAGLQAGAALGALVWLVRRRARGQQSPR